MTVKHRWFHGTSLRLFLVHYISIETLYTTLGRDRGATVDDVHEQTKVEIGQMVFHAAGVLFLFIIKFLAPMDTRYVVAVLIYAQMGTMAACLIADAVLIRRGYIRPVRSANTKLRYAHCIYQVIIFCSDFIGNPDAFHLPPDVFIWATIHYCFEAVGLALEGLNVIGMSELAIICLINASMVQSNFAATGWALAFGMSSLTLSTGSLLAAMGWKLWAARDPRNHWDPHHREVDNASITENGSISMSTFSRRRGSVSDVADETTP